MIEKYLKIFHKMRDLMAYYENGNYEQVIKDSNLQLNISYKLAGKILTSYHSNIGSFLSINRYIDTSDFTVLGIKVSPNLSQVSPSFSISVTRTFDCGFKKFMNDLDVIAQELLNVEKDFKYE
jgi:hypothetical protein